MTLRKTIREFWFRIFYHKRIRQFRILHNISIIEKQPVIHHNSGPDFIALLQYKDFQDRKPINSGCMLFMKFAFDKMYFSHVQTFLEKETLLPGEATKAEIQILVSHFFANRYKLQEGMEFHFMATPKTILGKGKILEILNENLRL